MSRRDVAVLGAILALVSAVLLVFSQYGGIYSDEDYHLLASWLVRSGELPYRDFFYQQVPLYPIIGALWMRVAGATWQAAHVLSALSTIGTIVIVGRTFFELLPARAPRRFMAGLWMALFGLNLLLIMYATIAMPFAVAGLFLACAFRFAVQGARSGGALPVFLAAAAASAATQTSLLMLPAAGVLIVWLLRSGAKSRATLVAGLVLPALPLLYLWVVAPAETGFDIIQYHTAYRSEFPRFDLRSIEADILELGYWLRSPQDVLTLVLALIGGLSLWGPLREYAAAFKPVVWLVIVQGVCLSLTHPTFRYYFVTLQPFLCILAVLGVTAMLTMPWTQTARRTGVGVLLALFVGGALPPLVEFRGAFYETWRDRARVLAEMRAVVPVDAAVYADASIALLSQRRPAPGMESGYGLQIVAPDTLLQQVHIATPDERRSRMSRGCFLAALLTPDDTVFAPLHVEALYRFKKTIGRETLLWDPVDRGRCAE